MIAIRTIEIKGKVPAYVFIIPFTILAGIISIGGIYATNVLVEFYKIDGMHIALALLALQAIWLYKIGALPRVTKFSLKQGLLSIKMPP